MLLSTLKDIRAKIFQAIDFLNVISYLSHKIKKNWELPTRFRDKTCRKQP